MKPYQPIGETKVITTIPVYVNDSPDEEYYDVEGSYRMIGFINIDHIVYIYNGGGWRKIVTHMHKLKSRHVYVKWETLQRVMKLTV